MKLNVIVKQTQISDSQTKYKTYLSTKYIHTYDNIFNTYNYEFKGIEGQIRRWLKRPSFHLEPFWKKTKNVFCLIYSVSMSLFAKHYMDAMFFMAYAVRIQLMIWLWHFYYERNRMWCHEDDPRKCLRKILMVLAFSLHILWVLTQPVLADAGVHKVHILLSIMVEKFKAGLHKPIK